MILTLQKSPMKMRNHLRWQLGSSAPMIEALKMQGWLPDYDKPRDQISFNLEGGVLTPGWFNVEVMFSTFDDAKAAEEGFRGEGYVFELLDEIDEYSNTTFAIVSKPAGTATLDDLFDQAIKLADRLGGCADGAWISPRAEGWRM
jgi:hypothetical protein